MLTNGGTVIAHGMAIVWNLALLTNVTLRALRPAAINICFVRVLFAALACRTPQLLSFPVAIFTVRTSSVRPLVA
jgi:hypothetical protein